MHMFVEEGTYAADDRRIQSVSSAMKQHRQKRQTEATAIESVLGPLRESIADAVKKTSDQDDLPLSVLIAAPYEPERSQIIETAFEDAGIDVQVLQAQLAGILGLDPIATMIADPPLAGQLLAAEVISVDIRSKLS